MAIALPSVVAGLDWTVVEITGVGDAAAATNYVAFEAPVEVGNVYAQTEASVPIVVAHSLDATTDAEQTRILVSGTGTSANYTDRFTLQASRTAATHIGPKVGGRIQLTTTGLGVAEEWVLAVEFRSMRTR